MAAFAIDVCVGPVDPLCNAVGGLIGSGSRAASDMVLGGLGGAFVEAADAISRIALAALDATTSIDLTAGWFRQNLGVIAAVTLPAVLGLFVLQVISSVLRREPGGLGRAVLGVGKAFLGAAIAIAVTQTGLLATDQICQFIAASAGTTVEGAARRFFVMSWLAGPQVGPILQVILGLGIILGSLLLWTVLLFRKAALLLVVVFAPIAFAGAVWDQTRVWTRRWIEIVAALVLCKVVIVVVFVVGASAFGGVGPATPEGTPVSGATSTTDALSDLLVGLLLLTIAVFSPWLTWRFVHWSGMEAAAVMHGSVAANPVSNAMRTSGSQARFAAQQAVTTMLLGGAAMKASGKPVAPAAPPPDPVVPGGGRGPGASNGTAPPRRNDRGERP
jgi:hypothetical protein